jgi:hypothetical protein
VILVRHTITAVSMFALLISSFACDCTNPLTSILRLHSEDAAHITPMLLPRDLKYWEDHDRSQPGCDPGEK